MVINEWVGLSIVAVGIIIVGAIWRQRTTPEPLSVDALSHRIAELEATVARQEATIQTLLRSLSDRDATIQRLNKRVLELERHQPLPAPEPVQPDPPAGSVPQLLVVLGNDPQLRVDLDALRGVERAGKLTIARPYPDSMNGIRVVLDRNRNRGEPIRYVHFAVHSAPEGIELGRGELVTPDWLSDNLKSVQILFINGCRSDAIGDWLGVVPYTVAMRHEVANTDAVQFAYAFWDAVGDGLDAEAAFRRARQRSPQVVSEYVELLR